MDTNVKTRTLKQRIESRIQHSNREVFLRSDFKNMGRGYDQVGRVLRQLSNEGKIIKIGYGLYAKATIGPISKRPVPRKGIKFVATEALRRLNVVTVPSSYEQAYNNQQTTQVPTGRVIGVVKSRISRKIGYDGKTVTFERVN
jgi:hypothetical protein